MNYWVAALALSTTILTASSAASVTPTDFHCDAPEGIPASRVLLFGEMHGSAETPALVGRVACGLATGGPTALALEIDTAEQERIDAFLASDGGEHARRSLLQGRFWRSNDGRSSQAKLDLLEFVRTLKQQGLPLDVTTFIPPAGKHPADVTHDERMARELLAFHHAHPEMRVVALMGNIHAGKAVIELEDFRLEPTGYHLRDLDATSILVANPAGSVWVCGIEDPPQCGVRQLKSGWGDDRASGFSDELPPRFSDGYDLSYTLPCITASPPALHGSPSEAH